MTILLMMNFYDTSSSFAISFVIVMGSLHKATACLLYTSVFADGDWIESKDQADDGIRLIQTGNVGNGVYLDKGERARYLSLIHILAMSL